MKLRIKGFKITEGNPWSAAQIRDFCTAAVTRIGGDSAWRLLVPDLRRSVIAAQAFEVVRSSWREEGVLTEAMNALLADMERMIGLEG